MVSRITAAPSATALMAMNWACMSVGNAGYGAVRMLTAFSRAGALRRMASKLGDFSMVMSQPASISLSTTASR